MKIAKLLVLFILQLTNFVDLQGVLVGPVAPHRVIKTAAL